MKPTKLFFMVLALVVVLLGSCKSDPVIEYEAKMTSFGFYAEDNAGIIVQDYVDSTFTGTSINILMPEEIDKTKLIARFTVTDNDVVKIGEVTQQSGVTVNDFSVPVDYIVTEGTANVRYTVTVGKAPAYEWSRLSPPMPNDSTSSTMMKVNPVTGEPYLVFRLNRPTNDEQRIGAFEMKNGSWTDLGVVSDGRTGSYFDITFNSQGKPYVSYLDYTVTPTQRVSVKSYANNSWSFLGEAGATTEKVSYHALSFVNDNKLMLAGMYDGRDNVLPRRDITVNFFENNAWVQNQTVTGRTGIPSWHVTTEAHNGVVYLGVFNAVTPNSVSVYKYENSEWSVVIDQWNDTEATSMSTRDMAMDVDKDGNIYVALTDNSSETTLKHRVIKYDATDKQVSVVGGYLPNVTGGLFNFDIAVSPLGVPYLFYRNETLFPTVVSIDKDTQDWTAPHVFESAEADDLHIDFAPDGIGYVQYSIGNKKSNIVIHKLAPPAN